MLSARHSADRVNRTQWGALGRHMQAALFTGHVTFSFNLFISFGIKKLSTEFGRGLWKDYTAVSNWDTCLGCTKVGGVKLEYSWPNYASLFHGLTATEKPEQLTIKLVKVETWRENTEMTINVTTNGLDDQLCNFICPWRLGSLDSPRHLKTSSLIMHHK